MLTECIRLNAAIFGAFRGSLLQPPSDYCGAMRIFTAMACDPARQFISTSKLCHNGKAGSPIQREIAARVSPRSKMHFSEAKFLHQSDNGAHAMMSGVS
jgi:hypothetical protein